MARIVRHDLAQHRIMCDRQATVRIGTLVIRGRFMISKSFLPAGVLAIGTTFASAVCGADTPSYCPELQGFSYPPPVAQFDFASQRQTFHMAYLDVHPKTANGQTALLLDGRNLCA